MAPTRNMADISSNDGTVDIAAYAKAGHSRIAIKATQGNGYVNLFWRLQVKQAHAEGLSVLHYHFAEPENNDSVLEANHFLRNVRPMFVKGDGLSLDLERGLKQISIGRLVNFHNNWCRNVHAVTGSNPISYMSMDYYLAMANGLITPGGRFWIAKWSEPPPKITGRHKLWAWQFTDGGAGPQPHAASGIGACDLSRVNLPTVTADYLRLRRRRGLFSRPRR